MLNRQKHYLKMKFKVRNNIFAKEILKDSKFYEQIIIYGYKILQTDWNMTIQ